MKAMIIVNNGLEECEALITYDLLYRAGIKTDLVGFTDEILSSHEVRFKAHRLLDEIDPAEYDCLILPGGMPGTKNLENDERVQKLIDDFVKENKLIAQQEQIPGQIQFELIPGENEFDVLFVGTSADSDQKANRLLPAIEIIPINHA